MTINLVPADWEKLEKRYEVSTRNQFDDRFVAMANSLARRQVKWSVFEQKLFFLTISQLQFTMANNPTKVILKKKDIFEKLGLNPDNTPGGYLRSQFKMMMLKSYVEWEDEEDPEEIWEDGYLVINVKATKKEIFVTLNENYLPLLEGLCTNYTMMLLDDLVVFSSGHTLALYQQLRRMYDTRYLWNEKDFTTKQLKELFGLSKDDYMRKDGKFDRYNFEKYCVQVAVDEINEKAKMLGGLTWRKTKKDGLVDKYVFRYAVKPYSQDLSPQLEAIDVEPSAEPPKGQTTIFDEELI